MSAPLESGFLVVLAATKDINTRNPKYVGVDRIPEYPSKFSEEEAALDDYVFGDYKNIDTNLIPDYSKAYELWQRLAISRRQYEILMCCSGPSDPLAISIPAAAASVVPLGYDVAAIQSDCWSIVDDFASGSWAERYRTLLNEYGLFDARENAERYLKEYQAHGEPDNDAGFAILFVLSVRPLYSSRSN